jgi:hypothetical protein
MMVSPRMISIACRGKLSLLLIWMMCAANTGRCQARPKQPRSYVLGPSQSQPVSSGKACGFYIWDAPSALLHRWCHHLQRDCIYEGTWCRVQSFRHLEFHCCLCRLPRQMVRNNLSLRTSQVAVGNGSFAYGQDQCCNCSIPAIGIVQIDAFCAADAIRIISFSVGPSICTSHLTD